MGRYEYEVTRALYEAEQDLLKQDDGYQEWLRSLDAQTMINEQVEVVHGSSSNV